ncbi:MAG: hypothetical protein M3P91_03245 [Actinomycetota bacterium]|nr:hypothetical protein [Actinomycetota bacterium]
MSVIIDPDDDFASYYGDGGDPDRDCERLYVWHRALWGRAEAGVAPFRLDVVYDRGYVSLHAADGSQFWLGSDGMIPTWSSGRLDQALRRRSCRRDRQGRGRLLPSRIDRRWLHRLPAQPHRPEGVDDQPGSPDAFREC